MKKNTTGLLKERILELEKKQAEQFLQLKDGIKQTYASVQPVNILKRVISKQFAHSELKDDLVNSLIGLASGFLAKKAMLRSSKGSIAQLIGNVIQFGIATVFVKHYDDIRKFGEDLLQPIIDFIREDIEDNEDEEIKMAEDATFI